MIARLLAKFADWALAKNASGAYCGEDDKRWAYTIETDGDPYLTRIMLPWRIFGVRPYLHHFLRPDADRVLHNHPWAWALSIVLCGSYDEERLANIVEPTQVADLAKLRRLLAASLERREHRHRADTFLDLVIAVLTEHVALLEGQAAAAGGREVTTIRRRVRFLNFLTKRDYHRVEKLHGDVWTIFITGPRLQDWGFLVDGLHVPWRKYLGKDPQ